MGKQEPSVNIRELGQSRQCQLAPQLQRNNLSKPKYFLRTIRTYLLVAGSPWEFLRMWMKQLFLYLHEMYKCSWVLGSLFFSPWLYLMCVSSRLRAQRDKCTVHPHHNSTMFNYSPSKDTGQLSFKLVLYLWMIENQPSQYQDQIRELVPTNLENGELEIKIISQSARWLQLDFWYHIGKPLLTTYICCAELMLALVHIFSSCLHRQLFTIADGWWISNFNWGEHV